NQVGDKVPVIVNATSGGTQKIIEFAKNVESMGAGAIMLSPPTNLRNLDAVKEFYRIIADSITIPIIVQDEPITSNVYMPASFLAELNLSYIKLEEQPVPQKISNILNIKDQISIFGGLGGQFFLEELERGAVGTM